MPYSPWRLNRGSVKTNMTSAHEREAVPCRASAGGKQISIACERRSLMSGVAVVLFVMDNAVTSVLFVMLT